MHLVSSHSIKNTGKVLWTDKSPGLNILHGQWSSPTAGKLGGVEQILFAGGDGWLYSFDPKGDGKGNSKLLWKFDCNPKNSKWLLSGRGTRNNLIAIPVIYDGHVYIAVGQDPEHQDGGGHLWCIDPTKRGNVSPTLAIDKNKKLSLTEGCKPFMRKREKKQFPTQILLSFGTSINSIPTKMGNLFLKKRCIVLAEQSPLKTISFLSQTSAD